MNGRVLTCAECGTVTEVDEGAQHFDLCPVCDEDVTTVGTESPCPVGGVDCMSDDHHYGRGTHIVDDPT